MVVTIAACGGGSTPTAHKSGIASSTPALSTAPSSSPTSATSPTPVASLVHCATTVPAGDNLVIGTVVGDPTVVVRDIQDPAHARNLCTFDSAANEPQFVGGTAVAYETDSNQIVKADLVSGTATVLATYTSGFDSGQYAFSPDGKLLTYLDSNAWHLAGPSGDRVLSTLPTAPARGVSPTSDDSYLRFSPDGLYIAYFQTFHTGGKGETAPDQVRKASDGTLVYSTSGATMAVWASVPSRLFFRDGSGTVKRWDASSGAATMTTLTWIRPNASPDGRWIAYTFATSSGVGGIGFYSVQGNSVSNTTPPGRSGVRFLSNDLVWYIGEKACPTCFGSQPSPTGVTYIYSIAGASEVTSRLSAVADAWPRVTAPAL
jgi:Tol biopolymer transport system component